jgi:hypothetical protein
MMIVVLRQIQQIYADKWVELEAIDKKYNVVEVRLGFPPKKRYKLLSGRDEVNTLIVETQWPSMANLESTYEKALADPEYQVLFYGSSSIIKSIHWELYSVLP